MRKVVQTFMRKMRSTWFPRHRQGYATILKSYKELFSHSPASDMKMSEPVAEVLVMGDWAVVRGTGSSTEAVNGSSKTKTYKWIIFSQNQDDGTWNMVWDIFNYDDPYENNPTEG